MDVNNHKHMLNLKTYDKSKSFPGLPWSALEQQYRVLQHFLGQKGRSALQLCTHTEKLSFMSYVLKDGLFFVWMTRRLGKQMGKTELNCMFLKYWKRVTLMLTQLTCVLILCKYVHVILSPHHSSSFHPHAMLFSSLYFISPPPDAWMRSFYVNH